MTTDRGSSQNNSLVKSHHSGSSAEQTIVTHSDPDARMKDRPLVIKKTEGVIHLTQPMVMLVVGVMTTRVV